MVISSLERRYRVQKRIKIGAPIDRLDMANWMAETILPNVKWNSWCTYKSSFLKTITDPGELSIVKARLTAASKSLPRRKPRQSKRKKSIADITPIEFSKKLSESNRQYAKPSAFWFRAILHTGMRPKEFATARLVQINNNDWIECENLKTAHNRGAIDERAVEKEGRNRSLTRVIPIYHLPQNERQIINAAIVLITKANTAGHYEKLYESCRKCIYAVSDQLGHTDKRISLLTARHIYRDKTKDYLSSSEIPSHLVDAYVAILMGHGSKKTNYAYGEDKNYQTTDMAIDLTALDRHLDVLMKRKASIYSY